MPLQLKPISDYIMVSANPVNDVLLFLYQKNVKSESETLFNNRDDIKSVEFSDFKIIKVLGMGAFGKVKEKIKLGVLSRIHKDWRIICDENLKKRCFDLPRYGFEHNSREKNPFQY